MSTPSNKPAKKKLSLNKKTILKLDRNAMAGIAGASAFSCDDTSCACPTADCGSANVVNCKSYKTNCDALSASCRIANC